MARSLLVETVMERLFSSTVNSGAGNFPTRMTLDAGLFWEFEKRTRMAPSMIGWIERMPPGIEISAASGVFVTLSVSEDALQYAKPRMKTFRKGSRRKFCRL
jgi:hypothetical protein